MQLPTELQKELVDKAAARFGNCQELAKHLNIPKSSVHYYRTGRLTMPASVLEQLLHIANDNDLRNKIESRGITKDRSWATEYAQDIFREMCREKLRLPTKEDLENDESLRRKAGAIVSYVLAEGSVWLQKEEFGEYAANITFADHETDLYEHFRSLCRGVFYYDIGPPQRPGNGALAIRGFIYSRFVAEWLVHNGVRPGEKSAQDLRLPSWVMNSNDPLTYEAALQPWCDGEGSVQGRSEGGCSGFSMVQSRHTDLDFFTLPRSPSARGSGRILGLNEASRTNVFGVPVLSYLYGFARSEILEDVKSVSERLGFRPRMSVCNLRLNDDGFWSCIWKLSFTAYQARTLMSRGLITQARKVSRGAGTIK